MENEDRVMGNGVPVRRDPREISVHPRAISVPPMVELDGRSMGSDGISHIVCEAI